MDFKQIQELIKLVNASNIGELTVEQKDFKIVIKQKEEQVTHVMASSLPSVPMYAPLPQQGPQTSLPLATSSSAPVAEKPKEIQQPSNTVTIKSPMIGTFYRKSSPDK